MFCMIYTVLVHAITQYSFLKISRVTTDTIPQAEVFCHIILVTPTMQQLDNGLL